MYRGALTPRKARALALHLPPGAMTWLEAGTDNAWGPAEYILADLFDLQQTPQDGSKLKDSQRYPRPKDARAQIEERERMLARAAKYRAKHKQ